MDPSMSKNSTDSSELKPDISHMLNTGGGGLRGNHGLAHQTPAYPGGGGGEGEEGNNYMQGVGYTTSSGGAFLQGGGQYYSMPGHSNLAVAPAQSPGLQASAAQAGSGSGFMSGPAQGQVFNIGQSGGPGSVASGHPGATSGQMAKHLCAICGDRASGKHYGVYSCEGCKGFFKRTVRKDLQYACRDDKNCVVDKRQRNRCQYCRYVKCLNMGMKREAVQEERQRAKERGGLDDAESSSSNANSEMPVELILEAELATDPQLSAAQFEEATGDNPMPTICQSADRQLFHVVDWAKRIPHFTDLPIEDQVILLRAGWNELLIAGFSHRSTVINDGILLATGVRIHRTSAHSAGVGTIFDRILTELVAKMREMSMDKTELGCLKAVVLFNPDAKGLQSVQHVESLREKVYASLEEYCKLQYPDEPGRFAKLLLRLPALRSIGLKFIEHLFFFKLIGDTPLDSFLLEMLDNSASGS